MDTIHDRAEHIYRFALPMQVPAFWLSAAGITCADRFPEPGCVTIAYISSGAGSLRIGETVYHVSGGDVCILTEPKACVFTEGVGNRIFFHMAGTAATSLLQAFTLEQTPVIQNCQSLLPLFDTIYDTCRQEVPAEQIMGSCSIHFIELFNSLHLLQQDSGIPEEVRSIKRFIDNNYCTDLRMDDISSRVFRSNDYAKKRFKQYYGLTPYAYYLERKMTHAKHLLQHTNLSVAQIADRLGFKSDRYFSKRFREAVGISATQFRKNIDCKGSTSMASELFCIESPQDLQKLRQMPSGSFRLCADVDLQGADWQPVDFSGTLDGNGHTIGNFRITQATGTGHQGFFGCLAPDARICDLTLCTVAVLAADNATHIGAFAGINRGTIRNCTAGADAPYEPIRSKVRNTLTGECDDSYIRDGGRSDLVIGAIAGTNTGTIAGVRSYLRLLTTHQGLCGKNAGTVEGLYRDVSNRSDLLPQTAITMRKEIIAHMELQGNFRWIPTKDMGFTSAYTGSYKIYEKDAVHYGLPYTQKNGAIERAQYCLDSDDHVADWLPGYSDAAKEAYGSEQTPWDVYMGNDCSGAIYWSWQRCCPCIEFGFTGDMVPTEENQKLYGVLPVGEYHCEGLLTDRIILQNTAATIVKGYALLHMGDAIVSRDPTYGHTRLAARDPVVMRWHDGTIDIDASYLATHEQGVGKGSSGRNSTWQLYARYTFRDLLDKHYLPITNPQLQLGFPAPVCVDVQEVTGPFSGCIRSNYRIISSTVSLTQNFSGAIMEHKEFTALDKNRFKETPKQDGYARSTIRDVQLQEHAEFFKALPAGTYTYTVSVQLSTGTQHIVQTGTYEV